MPDPAAIAELRRRIRAVRRQIDDERLAATNLLGGHGYWWRRQFYLEGQVGAAPEAEKRRIEQAAEAARSQVFALTRQYGMTRGAIIELRNQEARLTDDYRALVAGEVPLFDSDAAVPLVLLPIRIQVAYLPRRILPAGPVGIAELLSGPVELAASPGPLDLAVRFYPDDIHVDAHDPALSDDEDAAAQDYWRDVWAAGPDTGRAEAAWQRLLGRLRPQRAAWAATKLTPAGEPPRTATPLAGPGPEPPWPADVARRGVAPPRRPRTTLLPDRFVVSLFRNGELALPPVEGLPIPDTLPLSFDVSGHDQEEAGSPFGTELEGPDLPYDAGSRWLVDFGAAVAAGMAVRIELPDDPAQREFDQLLVSGVSATLRPADAAARLEAALDAHAATGGLAFVPPGTPTNNTSATRSGWMSRPTPHAPAAQPERRTPAGNANAALTATALGLGSGSVLAGCPGGFDDQQTDLANVQDLLWHVWGGGFLERLFEHVNWHDEGGAFPVPPTPSVVPWIDVGEIAGFLREHAEQAVRGRGTLPTLRVGRQPYGLLPVSSLDSWTTSDGDACGAMLAAWLRTLRGYWQAGAVNVPRVSGGATDMGTAVLDLFARQPVSPRVGLRGEGTPTSRPESPPPAAFIPGVHPFSAVFQSEPDEAATYPDLRWTGDGAAYSAWLGRIASYTRDLLAFCHGEITRDRLFQSLEASGPWDDEQWSAGPWDSTVAALTDKALDPWKSLVKLFLLGISAHPAFPADPSMALPSEEWGALQDLEELQRELVKLMERLQEQLDVVGRIDHDKLPALFRESLDIASHRLDAWITSLPARRLTGMRATAPTGCLLGAYGWVENLRPRTDLTRIGPNRWSAATDGYVHAPSMQHAATAAVLRSGFLSHRDAGTFAVDLRSRRVRTAEWLLGGVRAGQSLGALLGYRAERRLAELGLQAHLAGLRARYPAPLPPSSGEQNPAASAAQPADTILDGLALYHARQTDPDREPLQPVLRDLAEAVDAVGDLLLAESVHHLVGGNPLRAGLAADTLSRGEALPDRFDVTRTPRSGQPVTARVGALLPAAARATAGWATANRPRAVLDPQADAWAAAVLGPPAAWRLGIERQDGTRTDVTLADLGLCALDVAAEATDDITASSLGRRLADRLGGPVAQATGYAELAAVAGRLRRCLGGAHPIGRRHLDRPDATTTDGVDLAELAGRLRPYLEGARQAVDGLAAPEPGARRAALVRLADHGVPGAYPAGDDPSTLAAQAAGITAAAGGLGDDPGPPPEPVAAARGGSAVDPVAAARWLDAATAAARRVDPSAPVVPSFRLEPASDGARSLGPGGRPAGAPAAMSWLRRVARVRAGAAALHDVLLYREATDGAVALEVVQQPVVSAERWIALPRQPGPPPEARATALLHTPAPVGGGEPLAGLVFDEWTEVIPGLTALPGPDGTPQPGEVTGLAMHYDAPDARPPQAVLIAVPPDQGLAWTATTLLQVLRETIDLAKIRGVDLGDLPRLGRILPAVHVAFSAED